MQTFFTGCEHYSHLNIIKYCNRPFKDVCKMNEVLIRNHNERVKDEDVVYHLGDFSFYGKTNTGNGEETRAESIIKQLNGNHIFIEGNHDKGNRNTLKTKNEQIILNQSGVKIQVLHDPTYAKIEYDLILNSHVHNAWAVKELFYCGQIRLCVNCGVDVHGFRPIRLDEILCIYNKWRTQRAKINRWEIPEVLTDLNKYYNKR